jgi:hypothetical protein
MSFRNSAGGVATALPSDVPLPPATFPPPMGLEEYGGADNTMARMTGPTPEEITMKDVNIPYFNIAQRVGELGEKYDPGTLVLEGNLELPKPIRLVVLGFGPTIFVEKVEGGGRGAFCATPEEVVRVGGTIDYNEAKETGKPLYQRCAKALLFLEKPEKVNSLAFAYEWAGKRYCFCTWNMKATQYTRGAKTFFTARKLGILRDNSKGGYRAAFWSLDTGLEKYANNTYYVPKLRLVEETTPEFRAYITSVVGF